MVAVKPFKHRAAFLPPNLDGVESRPQLPGSRGAPDQTRILFGGVPGRLPQTPVVGEFPVFAQALLEVESIAQGKDLG